MIMTYTILSIVITILIYSTFIGAFRLGSWMAKNENENKNWVKILNKTLNFIFHAFMFYIIFGLVIQVLRAIGFLQI